MGLDWNTGAIPDPARADDMIDAMVAPADIDGQLEDGSHPRAISTRFPTAAARTADPLAETLSIDVRTMREESPK